VAVVSERGQPDKVAGQDGKSPPARQPRAAVGAAKRPGRSGRLQVGDVCPGASAQPGRARVERRAQLEAVQPHEPSIQHRGQLLRLTREELLAYCRRLVVERSLSSTFDRYNSAEETDGQGLILAKHRNGPTDAVKALLPQALREVRGHRQAGAARAMTGDAYQELLDLGIQRDPRVSEDGER
jgi:hypothetical protein